MTLHVRLYSRPGCHLCESTLQMVENLRDDYDFLLEEVNIEEDPALQARMGEQVPVLTVDGGNRVSNPIAEDRVRRAFDRALKARQEAPHK